MRLPHWDRDYDERPDACPLCAISSLPPGARTLAGWEDHAHRARSEAPRVSQSSRSRRLVERIALAGALWCAVGSSLWAGLALAQPCAPTRSDAEGPFYKPNAPVRTSIGRGLLVRGTVRSARGCGPLAGARLEWWQANASGQYDDAHRAIMQAGEDGTYRFETDFPTAYAGRPPHIHVKVFAPRHRPLTTQLYPRPGQSQLDADFVLVPE